MFFFYVTLCTIVMGYPNRDPPSIPETTVNSIQDRPSNSSYPPNPQETGEDLSDDPDLYYSDEDDTSTLETTPPNDHLPAIPQVYSSFEMMREQKMVYVDKTKHLIHFIENRGMLYRVSRPRRFGKTTFVQMLLHLFYGNETLFKGTAIYEKGNTGNGTWVEHPVIFIDFSMFTPCESMKEYENQLYWQLKAIGECYGIVHNLSASINYLIAALHLKMGNVPVVVLVDEYDAILNDVQRSKGKIDPTETINFMNLFFRRIKSSWDLIKFALVIGVSRYSLNSLSSGPNNFKDLTFHPNYTTLFGFTENEISVNFGKHIEQFASRRKTDPARLKKKLVYWYDGYVFSNTGRRIERVYNPVSVIECFNEQKFSTYWSSTGLLETIVSEIYDTELPIDPFENITFKKSSVYDNYNPKFPIPVENLMLDNGYLTISGAKGNELILSIPNNEIRNYLEFRLNTYIPPKGCYFHEIPELIWGLKYEFDEVNLDQAVKIMNDLCFPSYKKPLDESAVEKELTRRLIFMFDDIIEYEYCQFEGVYSVLENTKLDKGSKSVRQAMRARNKKQKAIHKKLPPRIKGDEKAKGSQQTMGDLDIVLKGVVNYVIEIKVGKVNQGIEQILGYFVKHFDAIKDALDNLPIHYILVLNFEKGRNNKIIDWVLIPCNEGTIYINGTTASSPSLITTAKTEYTKINRQYGERIIEFKDEQGDLPY